MAQQSYKSASYIGSLIKSAGNGSEILAGLLSDLNQRGIDTKSALANLPEGALGEIEAVSRLVSLARGNGYCVAISANNSQDSTFSINVQTPAELGTLQAGHHRDTITPGQKEDSPSYGKFGFSS